MNDEFQRLGAVRSALVVVVAAIAAAAGLSSSGLSLATPGHAVATVRPEVPAPVATVASPTTARRVGAKRHHRAAATGPRRKHCRAVAGVDFTVSVGQRCPKPLKNAGSAPHLSAKLRRAASRPRQVVVSPGNQQTPVTTTTEQPAAATTLKGTTTTETQAGTPSMTGKPGSSRSATPTVKPNTGAAEAPSKNGAR